MKFLKTGSIVAGTAGLMLVAAYGNPTQAKDAANLNYSSTKTTVQINQTIPIRIAASPGHSNKSKGGQVVESGPYHLELVVGKEATQTHLDFYLQRGDNHQTIPNAKITGQVQMPDRTQKALTFTYDQKEQHYTALLPGKVAGQYQMKITAEINGQKVDGRFTFSR
ncbi:hypothetical protein [Tychonema sp. BBK16]|uniref:hypothetical protein n=1 Tax=Tychonema sp. BBK16 TaxID=2699888 RepID=UPI0038D2B8B9